MKKSYFTIFSCIVFLLCCYFAVRPLFAEGFFTMHDDTQVGRIVVMGRALMKGQFPVRWVSDLGYGYGYPIYNFYAPLPYYVGGLFHAFGVSALVSTKIVFFLALILPGLFIYSMLFPITGILGALIGSVLYVYAPYHAVDIYVRGALGESWIFVFLPVYVKGIFLLCEEKKRKKGFLFSVIGLSAIVVSHTLLGYVTVLLSVLFTSIGLLLSLRYKRFDTSFFLRLIKAVGISLLVSAFFWLPAIVEMKYTNVLGQVSETANWQDHFVCLLQLWVSNWGFGGSQSGCIDGMSFMLGKMHIVSGLFGAAGLFIVHKYHQTVGCIQKPTEPRTVRFIIFHIVLFLLSVFFLSRYSFWVWAILPGFSFLQYPYRFMVFAVYAISVLGAVTVLYLKEKRIQLLYAVAVISGTLFLNSKWFTPQFQYTKPEREFESQKELRFRVSKISDEYLHPDLIVPLDEKAVVTDILKESPSLVIFETEESDTDLVVSFTSADEFVTVNKNYFPGWKFYLDSEPIEVTVSQGLPQFFVSKGYHELRMKFTNTPIRSVANIMSLFGIFYIIYLYVKKTDT